MATEKTELTKLKIDNLRPAVAGQRYEVADTHVSGLRVRIGDAAVETGKFRGKAAQISFVLLARFPSRPNPNPTRRTLGSYSRDYPDLTLEQARQKAAQWKAMIAAGVDPAAAAKRALVEAEAAQRAAEALARNRKSVIEALDRYDVDHLVQLRRGSSTRRALDGSQGLLAAMLKRDLREITRQDVADAVRARAAISPISANRQLAYARAFFNWCLAEDLIDENPAAKVRMPARERPRERFHSLEELSEIWRAAETLGYPFGYLYRLLIALPMRRDELAGLLVAELQVEPDNQSLAVWTLPAERTKRANALRVPLSPLARSIVLEALHHPARPPQSPFLFTTNGRSQVSGFAKAKARLDRAISKARTVAAAETGSEAAIMPHWTVHDLRTTFNTHACEQLSVDVAVADRILNHVASATTSKVMRVYNRSELFDQRHRALCAWASLVERTLAGGSERENIIAFPDVAQA